MTADKNPYQLNSVYVAGYRSLRQISFPVDRLSVFVGANGVGKTNLYRGLQIIQAAAAGTLAREFAIEGGMTSVITAGGQRKDLQGQVNLSASFGRDGEASYSYEISIGFPPKEAFAAFASEPLVKSETLSLHTARRKVALLERRGPSLWMRNENGVREQVNDDLMFSETALATVEDPSRFADLYWLRRTLLDWRFYHGFRTDADSPLRRPCLAITTPTLASDGANLAAVFATLVHIRGDKAELDSAIEDAFPGAQLVVPRPDRHATFGMIFADHPHRVFELGELSDGTLRYLALMGALLAYRLPKFVALNEPETSLHPALPDPLARLIVDSAKHSQIWLVTHSEQLAEAIAREGRMTPRRVIRKHGGTWIEGLKLSGEFDDDEADM
ncbi:MAG TPA: AAA family ATPase [Dongiaceae bacterium]|nr:AAA family ATPase [Dongiaceae bacterium]